MRLAIIGDRGIPARYSGFSTLTEQLATRLVAEYGWDVTVYCRNQYYEDHAPVWRGVKRVFLPAPGGKSFESIIHSTLSMLHAAFCSYDAAFVLDPGNAPLSWPLLLARTPMVFHTDGLGWQRRKWSRLQQRYYKWSEWVSAKLGDWLVTDALAMQRYYIEEYAAQSSFIPYSGAVGDPPTDAGLKTHGLESGGYYLVVARFEPENNVDLIVREYLAANCTRPLVIVGNSRYGTDYARQIMAEPDPRVRCLGGIYETAILNGLYRGAFCYLHGHEVGGTNPSLLRAMQAGAPCAAVDVVFTREVLGETGVFFSKEPGALAEVLARMELAPHAQLARGRAACARATAEYRWDAIAAATATLFRAVLRARREGLGVAACLAEPIYTPRAHAPPQAATADP